MRVIVTGGAGFIGSHIADALVERGDEVLVLDDLSTGRRENVPIGAALDVVDLRDEARLREAFAAFRPEAICHQGAQTSVSRSVREPILDATVNVLGTVHCLEAAIASGARRFVLASTGGAIYGEVPEGTRAAVGRALEPLSPYACSKLAAEAYVLAAARNRRVEATVLRYANVYGPRQDPHGEAGVVAIFCRRLLAGEPITVNAMVAPGDGGCVRDYVFVRDVVRLNLLALDGRLDARILNVCSGIPRLTEHLADRIAHLVGNSLPYQRGPHRDGDLLRSVLEPPEDPALHATVDFDVGLAETTAWFRAGASLNVGEGALAGYFRS